MKEDNFKVIISFFKEKDFQFALFEHQPVFTCDDLPIISRISGSIKNLTEIPQPHLKTLFLKDPAQKLFFLVSIEETKRLDLKILGLELNCKKLSFGNEQELLSMLSLTPGSVTPYGLLFSKAENIKFILDQEAFDKQFISFHPMRNDMTLTTSVETFLICMKKVNHLPQILKIPTK